MQALDLRADDLPAVRRRLSDDALDLRAQQHVQTRHRLGLVVLRQTGLHAHAGGLDLRRLSVGAAQELARAEACRVRDDGAELRARQRSGVQLALARRGDGLVQAALVLLDVRATHLHEDALLLARQVALGLLDGHLSGGRKRRAGALRGGDFGGQGFALPLDGGCPVGALLAPAQRGSLLLEAGVFRGPALALVLRVNDPHAQRDAGLQAGRNRLAHAARHVDLLRTGCRR